MCERPDYARVLMDLRRRRAELDAAISAIERLKEGAALNGRLPSPENASSAGPFAGMATGEAAVTYLAMVRAPMTAQEITLGLEEYGWSAHSRRPSNTVHVALRRLEQSRGLVTRVAGKRWSLAAAAPVPLAVGALAIRHLSPPILRAPLEG